MQSQESDQPDQVSPTASSSTIPSDKTLLGAAAGDHANKDTTLPDAKLHFFQHFQRESAELQHQMDAFVTASIPTSERAAAVERCLAGIARLSNDVKEASSYVPAYDQKSYADTIKALNERLVAVRRDFAPRPKFAFKSRLGAAKEGKVQGGKEATTASVGKAQSVDAQNDMPSGSLEGQQQGIVISDKSATWVGLPAAAMTATTTATVSNVQGCVVDLTKKETHIGASDTVNRPEFASMQIRDIRRSLVIAGTIRGPAHITGLQDCVMVVSCRQFRMHGCNGVDVYLECGSRPIIEDCKGVRFAPLPESLRSKEALMTDNLWDQVDDFKWLKSEPSPHWCVMSVADMLRDTTWNELIAQGADSNVEATLKAVVIR